MFNAIVIKTCLAVLSLCSVAVAQTPTASAELSLCTQYAYASVEGYDLLNNLWGMDEATSGSQCTLYYGAASGGGISWGSNWTWTGGENSVKAYPYAGRQFTRPILSTVQSLPTYVEWSYTGTDLRANVAYDLFTHPDQEHPNYNGEYELMIWLGRYGGVWPITESGSPLETVTLAGHEFDLYFGYNGDMKVYSFVPPDDVLIPTFEGDILDFFDYLEANYDFPMENQYLLSKISFNYKENFKVFVG